MLVVSSAASVTGDILDSAETSEPVTPRPTAVDLFAGSGGLTLGFHRAGFEVLAALEYDPVHAATHLFNFPSCEVICRDARLISGDEIVNAARRSWEKEHGLAREWPGIDVVIGGPPCQGFSTGGRRDESDERNNLILEFVRLVEEIQPKAFCMENVAGLLEPRHKIVREEAVARLRAAGYHLTGEKATLNVRDYGVPQSRRRVVLLGATTTTPVIPKSSGHKTTVREAFEGLPAIEGYDQLLSADHVQLDDDDVDQLSSPASEYARSMVETQPPAPSDWDRAIHTGARRTTHTDSTVARFAKTVVGTVEPKSRLFRLDPEGQARTIRAGSGSERGSHTSPRPIHPEFPRAITVREAARLQSFPDWFRFHTTNWHGHRQVGNSVPPLLAEVAAVALLDALQIERQSSSPITQGDATLLTLNRTEAAIRLGAPAAEIPPARRRGAIAGATLKAGSGD